MRGFGTDKGGEGTGSKIPKIEQKSFVHGPYLALPSHVCFVLTLRELGKHKRTAAAIIDIHNRVPKIM